MSSAAMPNSTETLTLEWLQTVLQDTTISAFEVTSSRLFETTSKLYVTLSYSGDAAAEGKPTHILLKGGFNPAMFAVPGYKPILLRAYTREVDVFSKFVPTLAKDTVLQVPKVYWTGADEDNAILAMQDLANAGFVFGDPTRTYSPAAVHSGIEQLAALHAQTWGWTTVEGDVKEGAPSAASLAWLEPNIYDVTMRGLLGMWDELILGEDRPVLPAILKDSRERTSKALENYFASRNPRFRCLVHGDPHSGNTYLKNVDTENVEVRFLDWQIAHIGTAFHDLAYFMVSMLTVEERRTHELAVLDTYLAALARHGGPTLSREDPEVMTEYRKAMMTGLGWVLTPHSMQAKARVAAMVERYAAAIVDHKTIELLTETTTTTESAKGSASVQVNEVANENISA
ncbi:hypothetical protein SBRCBS47491_001547 [Sporothrix bragantina]|uniref:CHK kinase-like domain-containing protein n=1 Tax=Sporothrix bragantina TaxID=671064 RepID=A0ABP0AZR0_9PEZI